MMKVIDAEKQVLGRMASQAAKAALMGEDVVIVNADKAYVSGSMTSVFGENLAKIELKNKGNFEKGPYHPKRPDRYVRKAVRGMLPIRKQTGRDAFKRIKVYIGVPQEQMKRDNIPLPKKEDAPEKKKLRRKVTVAEICARIGGKW